MPGAQYDMETDEITIILVKYKENIYQQGLQL